MLNIILSYSLVGALSSPRQVYIIGGDDYGTDGFIGVGYEEYVDDIYVINQSMPVCITCPLMVDQVIYRSDYTDIAMDVSFIKEYISSTKPLYHPKTALVVGITNSPSYGSRYSGFLLKLNGDLYMEMGYYYASGTSDVYFKDIIQISKNKFAINASLCEYTTSNCYPIVLLVDSLGDILWVKRFNFPSKALDGDITYNSTLGYIDVVRSGMEVSSMDKILWFRLDTLGTAIDGKLLRTSYGSMIGPSIDFLEDDDMYVIGYNLVTGDTCIGISFADISANITQSLSICSRPSSIHIEKISGRRQEDFRGVGWIWESGVFKPLILDNNFSFFLKYIQDNAGKFFNVSQDPWDFSYTFKGFIQYMGNYKPFIDDLIHDTCLIEDHTFSIDTINVIEYDTLGFYTVYLSRNLYAPTRDSIPDYTILCPFSTNVFENPSTTGITRNSRIAGYKGCYDKSGRKVRYIPKRRVVLCDKIREVKK